MKRDVLVAIITIILAILILLVCIGLGFAFAYGAYWLTLWAGSPKYVAVIVGIAVFCISGFTIKVKK